MEYKDQFETFGDGLLVRAPAKINLSLLIAGKRDDGFHEIETLMTKVNFYDEILLQTSQRGDIELTCNGPYWSPAGRENLVYQACKLLLENYPLKKNIKITLTKNIPAGSGLGSASSDAAATLKGLNKLLGLNYNIEKLRKLAIQLGSDVAFFLDGPLAICTGKGEKIEKIKKIFNFYAILILPGISVSTKRVYENYSHNQSLYKSLNTQINKYFEKNRFDLIAKMCANMLQESCFSLHGEIEELKNSIEDLNIGPLCLSGSGSTMFYIYGLSDEQTAKKDQRKIAEAIGCESILVSNNRW